VGPLARVWLNRERLAPTARAALDGLADRFESADPAASVFARGIEVLQAIDVAIAVIDAYEPPPPLAAVEPRAATGHAVTEAPRGMLYVAVTSDANGDVEAIRIVPPTSQNQACIEEDLRGLLPDVLDLPHEDLRRRCESAIRDYDPCISCSVHFLDLHLEQVGGVERAAQKEGSEPCGSG
jgi:coenzyme F420-reducing hydrogenase alpha subunit